MNQVTRSPEAMLAHKLSGDVISIFDSRFLVQGDTYSEVYERFLDMWPHLIQGRIYEAAELVGYQYWSSLTDLERSVCTLILKDFARHERPLISDWVTGHGQNLSFFLNHIQDS